MVSRLSTFFMGSKSTRLLKQGMAGQTVEMVEVSWMAKPWARSSRSITLSEPPALGVWAGAGSTVRPARTDRASPTVRAAKRRWRMVPSLVLVALAAGPDARRPRISLWLG